MCYHDSLFESKAKIEGSSFCMLHFPGMKRQPDIPAFMQLVATKEQDAVNGYSLVIQNIYKVRHIVPSAMPRPVSIDQTFHLLTDAGNAGPIADPTEWSDQPEFDPSKFFASVTTGLSYKSSTKEHCEPSALVPYFKMPGILKPVPRTPLSEYSGPQSRIDSLASSVASSTPTSSELYIKTERNTVPVLKTEPGVKAVAKQLFKPQPKDHYDAEPLSVNEDIFGHHSDSDIGGDYVDSDHDSVPIEAVSSVKARSNRAKPASGIGKRGAQKKSTSSQRKRAPLGLDHAMTATTKRHMTEEAGNFDEDGFEIVD